MDQLRLFVAVEPSNATRREIARVSRSISNRLDARASGAAGTDGAVRWTREENYHLTLHFLGDTPQGIVPSIQHAMRSIAGACPQGPELRLSSADAFPNARRPQTLVIALDDAGGRITDLAARLRDALESHGDHEKPFRPHITIGRVRRRATSDERRAISSALVGERVQPVSFRPRELVLLRSELSAHGPRYTAVSSVELPFMPPAQR